MSSLLIGFLRQFMIDGRLMEFQIQISKRLNTVPLTRNYISERETALRSHELNWSEEKVAAE